MVTGNVIAKISVYTLYEVCCFRAFSGMSVQRREGKESVVLSNRGFPPAGQNSCKQLKLLTQLDGSLRMSSSL